MKKFLCSVILILTLTSLVACSFTEKTPSQDYADGGSNDTPNPNDKAPLVMLTDTWDGTTDTSWYNTEETSFTLTTAEQLAGLAKLCNDTTDFKGVTLTLGVNVDLCGIAWTPIGMNNMTKFTQQGTVKIENFSGTFDGNGATISNLSVENDTAALFGGNNGVIKNCSVLNFTAKGKYKAAGLAGSNSGTVENCFASGSARAQKSFTDMDSYSTVKTGVLIGSNSGTVKNCYSVGSAYSSAYTQYTYKEVHSYSGGLMGYSHGGVVSNCYSTASSEAYSKRPNREELNDSSCGGLIGYCSETEVSDCYATGSVLANANGHKYSFECDAYAGGLVGQLEGSSVENSYRLNGQQVTATVKEEAYLVLTEAGTVVDMATFNTASFHTDTLGWDSSVWEIKDGQLPTLK